MPNDKNQFGYIENSGMGIAGYEDRKDNERNPQNKNTPPVTVQDKKKDQPIKKIDPPKAPITEDQDDDVLIFLNNEEKKERPLPESKKENKLKSGFQNPDMIKKHVEIPDLTEEEDRPWKKNREDSVKKAKGVVFRESEDWNFNKHRDNGACTFHNGNSGQNFVYRKKIDYLDPDYDESADINPAAALDELSENMSVNLPKDIVDTFNAEPISAFDDAEDFFKID